LQKGEQVGGEARVRGRATWQPVAELGRNERILGGEG